MLVFRGLGTRTKHSGSNTSSCGTTQWSTCHGGNSSSVCTCHGTPVPAAAAAAAETRWERFAGTRSPLQLAASCPQSKSRSQSHADVQLRLSRSSQVWAKKKLSPAAAFTSGMRRSWELLLPGASAHCGGRHWCDPNRAVCHRPTHGSTNQWLVNHRTQ